MGNSFLELLLNHNFMENLNINYTLEGFINLEHFKPDHFAFLA